MSKGAKSWIKLALIAGLVILAFYLYGESVKEGSERQAQRQNCREAEERYEQLQAELEGDLDRLSSEGFSNRLIRIDQAFAVMMKECFGRDP